MGGESNEKQNFQNLDDGGELIRKKRSRLFHYKNVQLYLFAKNGFTKGCIDKANELGNITLVSYGDILKRIDR